MLLNPIAFVKLEISENYCVFERLANDICKMSKLNCNINEQDERKKESWLKNMEMQKNDCLVAVGGDANVANSLLISELMKLKYFKWSV